MGLSVEQRIVTPTARKWADARALRDAMLQKVASYQAADASLTDLPLRNLAARLWRAVRHDVAPRQAADSAIAKWAEAELGTRIDTHNKLAQFRYALQQLQLGPKLLQALSETEKQAIFAAMPQPLPVETPTVMPEQELVSLFEGALRLLRLPLAYRT